MHRFVYSSMSVVALDEPDLELLLGTSRRNNERDGLTGILLHIRTAEPGRAAFVQLLEGERDRIEQTFGRIRRDDLHAELHILLDEPVAGRTFPTWSMRLERITHPTGDLADAIQDATAMQRLVFSFSGERGQPVSR